MADSLRLLLGAVLFIVLITPGVTVAEEADLVSSTIDYRTLITKIEEKRAALTKTYLGESNDSGRQVILSQASVVLKNLLWNCILPQWIGTPWDFNGTSEHPDTGSIACGYLVTTCLRDLGFRLHRFRLAQEPSEVMMRQLLGRRALHRFSNFTITDFIDSVQSFGPGIYIVGLDQHVGFLKVNSGDIQFCHSSYAEPFKVVNEFAPESLILSHSRYRVVGKIIPNSELTRAWLLNLPIERHAPSRDR